MTVHNYPESHSLYIELMEGSATDSFEVAPGIIADVDSEGNIVGIDVDTTARTEAKGIVSHVRSDRVAVWRLASSTG